MEFHIIPDSDALSRCAWCRKHIDENSEVFGLGAKLKPGIDLSSYQSHCIELELPSEEKSVCMIVNTEGSAAKKDGKDGMFMVCSKKCAGNLKRALEEDLSSAKLFESLQNARR